MSACRVSLLAPALQRDAWLAPAIGLRSRTSQDLPGPSAHTAFSSLSLTPRTTPPGPRLVHALSTSPLTPGSIRHCWLLDSVPCLGASLLDSSPWPRAEGKGCEDRPRLPTERSRVLLNVWENTTSKAVTTGPIDTRAQQPEAGCCFIRESQEKERTHTRPCNLYQDRNGILQGTQNMDLLSLHPFLLPFLW